MAETDLIVGYLVDLRAALRGFWPQRQRILAEVNDHLCEATERALAEGLPEDQAQRQALARFGEVAEVARRFADERVRANTERSLRWMLPGVAAMFAVQALAPLVFPVQPLFHWDQPEPVVEWMRRLGQVLAWGTLPLSALALGLRRRSVRATAAVLNVLVVCVALGGCFSALGEALHSLFSVGAMARTPTLLQTAVALWMTGAFMPTALALDASQATRRATLAR